MLTTHCLVNIHHIGIRGILFQGSASPLVDGNTFTDDPARSDVAIDLEVDGLSTVAVTNNQICVTGGDAPFELQLGIVADSSTATISGNVLTCEPGTGVLISGSVAADTTLTTVDGFARFELTSTLTINSGVPSAPINPGRLIPMDDARPWSASNARVIAPRALIVPS